MLKRWHAFLALLTAMFAVSFVCLLWNIHLTKTHNGASGLTPSIGEGIPFLFTLALIEVVNQITFRIAQKNCTKAIWVKFAFFWPIVLLYFGLNIIYLSSLPRKPHSLGLGVDDIAASILIGFGLTMYGFNAHIRFLLLPGKWQGLGLCKRKRDSV